MLFSSVIFIFYFLPAVLVGHFLLPRPLRNTWLLLASLFFYAWGEVLYIFLMLACIASNYVFGRIIGGSIHPGRQKLALAFAVAANLGMLGVFKYINFVVDNVNPLLAALGFGRIDIPYVPLPIGISFFTFQAMSYVIDVYRRETDVQRNPFRLALYISLFPQLIAGPIVRYHDVAMQLAKRTVTRDGFVYGIQRFTIGLGKKMLIANVVALPADRIFALPAAELTTGVAWLGAVCYTLQIYFDFSGYSDMVIGLGRMFGFHFLENFNYPYIARSIREFWRRWHISLSTWFRDYLYIPLGGNRGPAWRTHFNLVLVFFLCGLWHGAAWNFVFWGLYHGAFLVLERTSFARFLDHAWRPLRHVYTLLVVVVGWVFFRAESMPQAWGMLQAMAGLTHVETARYSLAQYMNNELLLVLVLGLIGSMPVIPALGRRIRAQEDVPGALLYAAAQAGCMVVLLLCCMALASQTHNPFIYFRF